MRRTIFAVLVLLSAIGATAVLAQLAPPAEGDALSALERLLHAPANNYRRDWVQLGSFSVRAEDAQKGAKELHVVYAAPETVDAYRETGAFPTTSWRWT
jgi:hypothetical protein